MLNVNMLSVALLNVIVLSVEAPKKFDIVQKISKLATVTYSLHFLVNPIYTSWGTWHYQGHYTKVIKHERN
jgi:hypothetical protein